MITLYQFQAAFNQPSGSPFCVKAHILLKMAGLDYKAVDLGDPRKAPKGKLPYIEDDGERVADTHFIRRHVEHKYGIDFDAGLSAAERAASKAFMTMAEDHLYWAGVYSRWIDEEGWPIVRDTFFAGLPAFLRPIITRVARGQVTSQIKGHGMGRHGAAEIYEMGAADIDALAAWLGDRPFFMGERPTVADSSVYAMTAAIADAPFETPMKKTALGHANLTAYCDRMRDRYFLAA